MVKLSLVIPYYNAYEFTEKLLETLIPQLTEEVEVYLIDDGCNETRLDKHKEINIIHLKENKGPGYASNTGIEKSKGEYIGFIDSDDMISNDYIEELIKAIDNHKEEVIFMDWEDIANGYIVRRPSNYAPWKAIYKREICPMFPNEWMYHYDVPFFDKLNKMQYSRHYVDKVLYYYNSQRPGNLTERKENELN